MATKLIHFLFTEFTKTGTSPQGIPSFSGTVEGDNPIEITFEAPDEPTTFKLHKLQTQLTNISTEVTSITVYVTVENEAGDKIKITPKVILMKKTDACVWNVLGFSSDITLINNSFRFHVGQFLFTNIFAM